jgi:SRSO17 transposase
MERRFRVRLDEIRGDAEVNPQVWRGVLPRLESFLTPFVACLNATEQRTNAKHDVSGLVSDLPSKDAESIAYLHDRERQGLQKFIGPVEWDDGPLRTALVRQGGPELGQADGVLVFDPSAFPKKGTASVGVQRQWCGRLGKRDNCQVGIDLGYVSRREHALVDFRLDLPKEWAGDRKRRKRAGIPTTVGFRTRHELILEMVDERGDSLPHAWISGDDELGRCSWFRGQLRSRNESYLLAVPSNTAVRDRKEPDPPQAGRGRRPRAPFRRVDQWRAALPEEAWQTIEVRDGENGPLVVQAVRTLVQARTASRPSDAAEFLVVFRERQADGSWKHDDLLSSAPLATPLAEFARVFKTQHRIEECLKRAKGEAGLGDYQVRTWEGWHHHQTLSLIATWFLPQQTRREKKADSGADGSAGSGTDRRDPESAAEAKSSGPNSSHGEPPVATQRRSKVLSLASTQTLAASTV